MRTSRLAKFYYFLAIVFFLFPLFIRAQEPVLVISGTTGIKERAKDLGLNTGVKSVEWKLVPAEGVTIELKRKNVVIEKSTPDRKGKYSIQMPVSTDDPDNDLVIYFTKDGAAPRMVFVKSYTTKAEHERYGSKQYKVALDVSLIPTTVQNVIPDKPAAKIKWDFVKKHDFVIDPVYAKQVESEEFKILANPDRYYTNLAKKGSANKGTDSKNSTVFVMKGNTRDDRGLAINDVLFETKKDGKVVSQITSGAGGKYSIQLDVSTSNSKNEYLILISKNGYEPKLLMINSYIPLDEFVKNAYPKYEFALEVKMKATDKTDIVLESPSGKIVWNSREGGFGFDQTYSKLVKDEAVAAESAKKRAEELARLKAEAEAKRLAELKTKEEADRIVLENLEKKKKELMKKRLADSLDNLAKTRPGQNGSDGESERNPQVQGGTQAESKELKAGMKSAAPTQLVIISPGVSGMRYGNDTINVIDVGDEKQGRWINFGKEYSDSAFASDAKYFEGTFENNKRVGDWNKYYPNGRVAANLRFDKGEFSGNYKFYYEDGNLYQERLKDKKFNTEFGRFREYSNGGDLKKEYQYDNNRRKKGLQFVYYANGITAIIANMENDTLQGYTNFYSEDGQSYLQQLYSKGILKDEKYYGDKIKFPEKLRRAFQELLSKSDSSADERIKSILSELALTDSQYREKLLEREDDLKSANMLLAEKDREILIARKNLSRSQLESQLKSAEVDRQRTIIWSVVIGLLLVLILSGYVIHSWYITRKQKDIIAAQKMEVEKAKLLIEEKNRDITDSINYAKRIQSAMLPHRKDIWNAFPQSFVLNKPRDIVSGDFYFFHDYGSSFVIAAADCTGHGVPGAFMSMISAEKLKDAVQFSLNVSEILSHLNKGIKASLRQHERDSDSRDGLDIALCAVDTRQRIVKYTGANRPLWIIRKGATEVEEIKATKMSIGGFTDDAQRFVMHEVSFNEGDAFYIFSDGYADTFSGNGGKKMTTRRFKEVLLSIQNKSMKEQEKHLDEFVEQWKAGIEQVDDILVIGIRV